MAFLEFIALFCAFYFLPTDPLVLALLLLIASLAIAFINVVTYAIMVIQSRKVRSSSVGGWLGWTIGCYQHGRC